MYEVYEALWVVTQDVVFLHWSSLWLSASCDLASSFQLSPQYQYEQVL